jgi:hypothetical protein
MMGKPGTHEALIYLMVVTSASDREMTDVELGRIGAVIRTWPIFEDFDENRLIPTAQACQRLLAEKDGLDAVLALARSAIPPHLHDTAYAAAFEVAQPISKCGWRSGAFFSCCGARSASMKPRLPPSSAPPRSDIAHLRNHRLTTSASDRQ